MTQEQLQGCGQSMNADDDTAIPIDTDAVRAKQSHEPSPSLRRSYRSAREFPPAGRRCYFHLAARKPEYKHLITQYFCIQ
jgi:hypothetical protein